MSDGPTIWRPTDGLWDFTSTPEPMPLPAVGDPVVVHRADGARTTLYVSRVDPHQDEDDSFTVTFSSTPVLDHEHEWVDVSDLGDDIRREICTVAGCDAERREQRALLADHPDYREEWKR